LDDAADDHAPSSAALGAMQGVGEFVLGWLELGLKQGFANLERQIDSFLYN
jgi:hypothetical protein